jgi:hypothetical protein
MSETLRHVLPLLASFEKLRCEQDGGGGCSKKHKVDERIWMRELQIEMKRGFKNGAFLEIWNQQSDVCVEGESEGHQAPLQKRK